MSKSNLVLLSYGSKTEYYRAILCVFSFFAHYSGIRDSIRVVIYTDDDVFFKSFLDSFQITYVRLSPAALDDMISDTTYIHRRKVIVIMRTFEQYPGEKLLFIDSDTFFCSDPSTVLRKVSSTLSFMHKDEYSFADGLKLFQSFNQAEAPQAFIDFIETNSFHFSGQDQTIDKHDHCWNSGVLGLDPAIAPLLEDVLKLTDQFYAHSKWFISEQLAFSVILTRNTQVLPCEEKVVHYWGKRQKVLMDEILKIKLDRIKSLSSDPKAMRRLTKKLQRIIYNDILKEQAVIALSLKDWKYGIKRLIIATIKNPRNISLLKELF